MTLTDALAALQAAGKIQDWTEMGGLLLCSEHQPDGGFFRICPGWNSYEDEIVEGRFGPTVRGEDWTELLDQPDVVLDDPATIGCLLALLREASDGHATCVPDGSDPQGGPYSGPWVCEFYYPSQPAYVSEIAPTEGEAIAAGLIALAEVA